MAKGLVVYFAKSGTTKKMAEIIAKSMNDSSLPTECKAVEKTIVDDLIGSRCHSNRFPNLLWPNGSTNYAAFN